MKQPDNTNGIRLDEVAVDLMGKVCKSTVEPQFNGAPLWDHLKPIAQECVKRAGVPSKGLSALDFAKALGLFR